MTDQEAKGWCILELMGHRKLAGFVSDDDGLIRIDVYLTDPDLDPGAGADDPTEPAATQWYGRQAVYCITASTKDMCLAVAQSHQPAPVGRWELPERVDRQAELDDVDEVEEEDLTY